MESPRKTRTVLVVDENEKDVLILRRAFQKAGLRHALIHVRDGQELTNYLAGVAAEERPLPDLLLVDLKMPLVDGFDVLEWLRNRQKPVSVPVVVFSSSELPRDWEIAKTLGAHDYLVKPDNFDAWIPLAKGLHEKWLCSD